MQYRRSRTKGGSFFFTVVTHERQKILCHEGNAGLVKDAFRHIASQLPFTMNAFVLLPDHIHCIWTLPEGDSDFSTRWRLIKSYFTMRCENGDRGTHTASRLKKGEQGVWQRRFWEHTIQDEDDFIRHLDYIHYNPVKHGFAQSP